MIALDDEIWKELDSSGEIPKQVAILKDDFNHDLKDELFYYELCDQYYIPPVSFAVVPHLVELAVSHGDRERSEIVTLCGLIQACGEIEKLPDGKKVLVGLNKLPLSLFIIDKITREYFESVETLKPLCLKLLENRELSHEDRLYLFFSLLAFHGQEQISYVLIINSTLDEFVLNCPDCEEEIILWPEDNKMVAYKEDAVFNKKAEKFYFAPAEINWKNWNGEFSDEQKAKWMMFLAEKYDLEPLKNIIPYLFSEILCPHCQESINILESLIDYNF
jgi:hypothetical protein